MKINHKKNSPPMVAKFGNKLTSVAEKEIFVLQALVRLRGQVVN
jgi:hypothetical protein